LHTIKFAGNLVKDFNDLEPLKSLAELQNLDLSSNPISEKDDEVYRNKIFDILPNLVVLDGVDRDGNEFISDDEEDEEFDGEELDDEEREHLRGQNGELDDDEEYDDEYDDEEEGEDGEEDEEDYDEEDEEETAGGKRGAPSNGESGGQKRRK